MSKDADVIRCSCGSWKHIGYICQFCEKVEHGFK